jgi:hypothetical protein
VVVGAVSIVEIDVVDTGRGVVYAQTLMGVTAALVDCAKVDPEHTQYPCAIPLSGSAF